MKDETIKKALELRARRNELSNSITELEYEFNHYGKWGTPKVFLSIGLSNKIIIVKHDHFVIIDKVLKGLKKELKRVKDKYRKL